MEGSFPLVTKTVDCTSWVFFLIQSMKLQQIINITVSLPIPRNDLSTCDTALPLSLYIIFAAWPDPRSSLCQGGYCKYPITAMINAVMPTLGVCVIFNRKDLLLKINQ